MTTIQNILDNHTSREAAAIFGDIIKTHTSESDWQMIFEAAKLSDIVNTDHGDSKKIGKFAPSQILRAMTAKGMAIWVAEIVLYNTAVAAGDNSVQLPHLTVVQNLRGHPNGYDVVHWPYSPCNLPLDFMKTHLDTDISEYIEFDDEGGDDDPADTNFRDEKPSETVVLKGFDDDENDYGEVTYDENTLDIANMAVARATNGVVKDIRDAVNRLKSANAKLKKTNAELANERANNANAVPVVTKGEDGVEITYTIERKNAQTVFGIKSKYLDFDINFYKWSGKNVKVPVIEPHYKFDVEALSSLLFAWENNVRSWIGGSTGTGKSTLVAQACAYTGTELYRFACHKETSTYNLIGKVDVKDGESFFKDGVLPTAMSRPSVLLLDEADAALGDITMALQPVLEGNSLLIGEDGARVVHPHPLFRICATANTYGSGDSTGMYSTGVKVQSRASMNRYGVFIHVDYLAPAVEMKVAQAHVKNLSKDAHDRIYAFLKAYRQSFKNGAVQTPVSPRNTITMAQIAAFYEPILGCPSKAVERAITSNVVLSADEADADIIKGIADKAVAP